jgi:hypothetical protein
MEIPKTKTMEKTRMGTKMDKMLRMIMNRNDDETV